MRRKISPRDIARLKEISKQFKIWRKANNGKRAIIPHALWKSAAELARDTNLNYVSKELKLNHTALKLHIQELFNLENQKKKKPAFMKAELDPASFSQECVIEMEKLNGSKMKIHIRGNFMQSLSEATHGFWSH